MHERLSFYVKRDSALHHLNPLTKIILALSIILDFNFQSLVLDISCFVACW